MIGVVNQASGSSSPQEYDEYGEHDLNEDLYVDYSTEFNQHSVATYQEMLDGEWADEPLRELLETRIDDMLER